MRYFLIYRGPGRIRPPRASVVSSVRSSRQPDRPSIPVELVPRVVALPGPVVILQELDLQALEGHLLHEVLRQELGAVEILELPVVLVQPQRARDVEFMAQLRQRLLRPGEALEEAIIWVFTA